MGSALDETLRIISGCSRKMEKYSISLFHYRLTPEILRASLESAAGPALEFGITSDEIH